MNSLSMRLWAGLFVLVVFVSGVAGGSHSDRGYP